MPIVKIGIFLFLLTLQFYCAIIKLYMSAGQIIVLVWTIGMNALGINLIVKDKQNAIERKWRVRESTLFWVAFLFGAPGVYLGMQLIRHKTKKFFFYMGIPMLIWWNIFAISILLYVLA